MKPTWTRPRGLEGVHLWVKGMIGPEYTENTDEPVERGCITRCGRVLDWHAERDLNSLWAKDSTLRGAMRGQRDEPW